MSETAIIEAPREHRCDPPCVLMQVAEHRRKRQRMTKAQLLADADLSDEVWLNESEEREYAEWYSRTLEWHLRAHGCEHDLAHLTDEPAVPVEEERG